MLLSMFVVAIYILKAMIAFIYGVGFTSIVNLQLTNPCVFEDIVHLHDNSELKYNKNKRYF